MSKLCVDPNPKQFLIELLIYWKGLKRFAAELTENKLFLELALLLFKRLRGDGLLSFGILEAKVYCG